MTCKNAQQGLVGKLEVGHATAPWEARGRVHDKPSLALHCCGSLAAHDIPGAQLLGEQAIVTCLVIQEKRQQRCTVLAVPYVRMSVGQRVTSYCPPEASSAMASLTAGGPWYLTA